MNLFLIIAAVIFSLSFIAFSIKVLIDYCFNQTRKDRDSRIADRHDQLIQDYHFFKDNSGK